MSTEDDAGIEIVVIGAACEHGRSLWPHSVPRDQMKPCPYAATCSFNITNDGVPTGKLLFLCPTHFEEVLRTIGGG